MNGVSGGCGRDGRGRHRRHRHRVGRRWGVLLPLRPSRPEKPFENDAQADQDENAGPPMSPEKQNRQSDQPEGAAERPPWIVGSRAITVSSISAHNISFCCYYVIARSVATKQSPPYRRLPRLVSTLKGCRALRFATRPSLAMTNKQQILYVHFGLEVARSWHSYE